MALVALAYFPSVTSALAILFAVIALPVKPLQVFLSSKGLRGWIKAVVLCAVFLGAIAVTPTRETAEPPPAQPSYRGTLPSAEPEQSLEPTQLPTELPTEEITPEPTAVPTSSPSLTPSPTPSPSPTSQPTQPPVGNSGGSGSGNSSGGNSTTNEITGNLGRTAYWTPGGRSYHFSSNCRSLARSRDIRQGTLQAAINAGKTDPCNNCAGGR